MTPRRFFCFLSAACLLGGASVWAWRSAHTDRAQTEPPPWFTDITDTSKIDFIHDTGPLGDYFMPQILGSGAALFDFDGDGRLDVLLLNNGGPKGRPNQLYRQKPDGTFENVSDGSGLDFAGYNMGAAIGDVNNDGRPDVLVTQYGSVRLLLNNGGGVFVDVTRQAGLFHTRFATSAAFVDYDRDGWLDLIVANYVAYDPSVPCRLFGSRIDFCAPKSFPGSVANLYRNLGRAAHAPPSQVRFQDATESSGLSKAVGPGLGVACADFDGDGWPDILIANDGKPNHLWMNQKNGTFVEEAVSRGVALNSMGKAEANMGVALGDVDGDGLFDVFVTHLNVETNTLWKQGPRGLFLDRSTGSGLARPARRGTGFGVALADFDQDGFLDAAVVNGLVSHSPEVGDSDDFWAAYAQTNQLFSGTGTGTFDERSSRESALCGTSGVWRGLAYGDIDGDGALDLLATCAGGRARLYRNAVPQRGHWLLVAAVDPAHGGRPAYGAEIRIEAGRKCWLGWINPGTSYLCSNDPRAHFGLGSLQHVESIRVRWPDGVEETFPGIDSDQKIKLVKGTGTLGETHAR